MASSNAVRSDTCSTRLPDSSDPQLSQRIWLEVGHTYERRYWKSGRAVPEDWRVWVRGVAGADITALIDKVVFRLCPDTQFPFPKRICLETPFELEEAGSAPTDILIDIHLKCSTKPQQFEVQYGSLFNKAEESSADSRCIFYDVQHPSAQLIMIKSMTQSSGSDSDEVRPRRHAHLPAIASCEDNIKEVVEPTEPQLSHKQLLLFESCAICDNTSSGAICPLLLQIVEPTEPQLSHKQMLLFESCAICDNTSSGAICPLLLQRHRKRKSYDLANPTNPKQQKNQPSQNGSKHNNFKRKMIKPSGSARRRCHRCLTRRTPCSSCQSPRSR